MPELGDVEAFRRAAHQAAGRPIEHVDVIDAGVLRNTSAQRFERAFRHRRFATAERRGKWLVIPTEGPLLVVHFGMTGSLRWITRPAPVERDDRVVFATDAGELRYRDLRKLQGLYVVDTPDDVAATIGPLGPDALMIDADDLHRQLVRRRVPIKAALTDQTVVAGIGNMLSDEILWRAHIDPRTPTADLAPGDWRNLHRSLRHVCRVVARAGHTPRGPTWLSSVRWDEPGRCPVCDTTLQSRRVRGRTAVSCPRCQPAPRGSG